jgi:DNA-binding LacI/PurR family transcriptional regulator
VANVRKYELIYDEVRAKILTSAFRPGDQLPTEAEFMRHYLVSRPTVAKALRMLEHEGLVTRTPGLGTIVRANNAQTRELLLGLAFPEMGHGEIFGPIANRIAALGKAGNFSLLWGTTKTKSDVFSVEELLDLFEEYIARGVDGVFFAPLEGRDDTRVANRKGLERLSKSSIPVVLIDRDCCPFPERSSYPLVGIDNIKAGYIVAEHYLSQKVQRVDFLWSPYRAYTVELRIRGYRLALSDWGVRYLPDWLHFGDPEDHAFVRSVLDSGARNLICGNDEMAALLIHTLRDISVDVPGEVRVAAFDDVKYGRFLSVPLTTVHQPIEEIAERAVAEMQWCLSHSESRPAATTQLGCTLVVRHSSIVPVRSDAR